MTTKIVFIISILLLVACSRPIIEKPEWMDKMDTINIESVQATFKTSEKGWQAFLYTQLQPVQLNTVSIGHNLFVENVKLVGVLEGPAKICLVAEKQFFFYDVYLKNNPNISTITKEFRSPKTVNPDSSLLQQRILFRVDNFRNLQPIEEKLFFEENVKISPKAGVFQAVKDQPLSSYYVQPGSCQKIPLKNEFLDEENIFEITAGQLKDSYENIISDGTLILFIHSTENSITRREAVVRNGFASIKIAIINDQLNEVWAMIDEVSSEKIKLYNK